MRYCKKCVMPDTKPDLFFDKDGICVACRAAEEKNSKIDWKSRKKELDGILDSYRTKDYAKYDCIVPVSGGKDSTYQLFIIKDIYKMKPLCVHFEPTNPSEIGRRNLENLRRMGVDIISFKPNPVVYEKICREAFTSVGDYEWPNHVGIFTIPVQIAVKYQIPLIIWGENSQLEYGGPKEATQKPVLDRRWLEEFGGLLGLRVNDLKKLGITDEDMKPYIYPAKEELDKLGLRGIFLGYYLKWDARKQVEIAKKLGFMLRDTPVEGTYLRYENLDEALYPIHDYFKYLKFGFSRATDHASTDIRTGRLSRKDALRLVALYDNTLSDGIIDAFCAKFGFTREEFFKIVDKFANKSIFKVDEKGRLVRENGKLVNIQLQTELEMEGIGKDEQVDIEAILNSIDAKLLEQIERDGYVNELIMKHSEIAKKLGL